MKAEFKAQTQRISVNKIKNSIHWSSLVKKSVLHDQTEVVPKIQIEKH